MDIQKKESGIAAEEPVTIPDLFKKSFKAWPKEKALCWKDKKGGKWESLSYTEYKSLIYNVAKSFLKVK